VTKKYKAMEINIGDTIICRPITYWGDGIKTITRQCRVKVSHPLSWQYSGVAIKFGGYDTFWLKEEEIIEVIKNKI
jgi:hypothetical protein